MVRQSGLMAETWVAMAIGLALAWMMVSIWGSDASRRAQETEGRVARADVSEINFYLPMLMVPAESLKRVTVAEMRSGMGPSSVIAHGDYALEIRQPFGLVYLYVGHSPAQTQPALWVYQNRFGNTQHHALMDAAGGFAIEATAEHLCLSLKTPSLNFCHRRLPGQVIHG